MKILALLVCVAVVVAALGTGAAAAEGGPYHNGQLRVDGVHLVNSGGEAIQLRGVSSHGLRWYPEYINYRAMLDLKERGANVFRLAMYADSDLGGYCHSDIAARTNSQLVYLGIENALEADLYVIVDWHILRDQNPLKTMNKAIDFFRELSSRYPDHPAIVYEICNEPNGETTWADIRKYAETVIPVIREKSPNALVLVGTPRWSSEVLSVKEAPLPFTNIMYSYHFYTGHDWCDFRTKLDGMRESGLPVFVSEWGLSKDKQTDDLNITRGEEFIEYLNRHNLSWVMWSLANKDESHSILRPGVTKLNRWVESDLTRTGRFIFRALSGDTFRESDYYRPEE